VVLVGVSKSIAKQFGLPDVGLLIDGMAGYAGTDSSEPPPGSLDRPDLDHIHFAGLELEQFLVAADLLMWLKSLRDLHLARCCSPYSRDGRGRLFGSNYSLKTVEDQIGKIKEKISAVFFGDRETS
jgi:hypothetical protein